ncbi:DnaJ homolog subfamily C member 28 [Clonorchis sinensis]|nr:DnaJ homolog subfamily C member 28 [Clonorchis sinensis]
MADELIEESMRRGDFDNLQGHGRPLPEHPSHHEIFVDRSTHKLTRILANQGYLPEWIQQGKELRTQWENSIDKLRKLHSQVDSPHTNILWKKAVLEFQEEAKKINRSIDRYNLMVPALHLQRCHVDASTIIQEILKSKEANVDDTTKESSDSAPNGRSLDDEDEGLGSNNDNIGEISDKNIWDPRYIGELMRDFYRELAKAFVSSLRGFKNHR